MCYAEVHINCLLEVTLKGLLKTSETHSHLNLNLIANYFRCGMSLQGRPSCSGHRSYFGNAFLFKYELFLGKLFASYSGGFHHVLGIVNVLCGRTLNLLIRSLIKRIFFSVLMAAILKAVKDLLKNIQLKRS